MPDGLIRGEWYDHKYHPVSMDQYSEDLMMLRLSELWYGKTILINNNKGGSSNHKYVLLASNELNAIRTGDIDLFNKFSDNQDNVTCSIGGDGKGECISQLDCSSLQSHMKNLTIQIDSVYYILPPNSLTETNLNCRILIEYDPHIGDMTMIGLPFFENFVTVYEYENGRVQLGLSVDAREGAAIDAVTPWDKAVDRLGHLNGWQILGLVVGVVAIILLLVFCCRCMIKAVGENRDESSAKRVLYE